MLNTTICDRTATSDHSPSRRQAGNRFASLLARPVRLAECHFSDGDVLPRLWFSTSPLVPILDTLTTIFSAMVRYTTVAGFQPGERKQALSVSLVTLSR